MHNGYPQLAAPASHSIPPHSTPDILLERSCDMVGGPMSGAIWALICDWRKSPESRSDDRIVRRPEPKPRPRAGVEEQ
jgi:hypothetical protein